MIFDTLVVKVTNACNLNCRYCYVFNKGDNSFEREPVLMSREVVVSLINKTKRHCLDNDVKKFLFIFHGGEPLLQEKSFYSFFVEQVREEMSFLVVSFALQTNGVLLTEGMCHFFNSLDIQIGMSLDGPRESNVNRVFRNNGKSAYDSIIAGAGNIEKNCPYGLRILSVINTDNTPEKVYSHFKGLNTSAVSFLLPDVNHNCKRELVPKVGNWLIALFDIWIEDKEKIEIQPFGMIVLLIMGLEGIGNEVIGTHFNPVLNIHTGGGISAVDSLKICKNGMTHTEYNVLYNDFDEVVVDELIYKYYNAHKSNVLHKDCIKCDYLSVCGGGQLAHRYSDENGFNNPSIYCSDMKKIIGHIQNRMLQRVPALKEKFGIQELISTETM